MLRLLLASGVSLLLALVFGRLMIALVGRRLRERVVSDSPTLAELHRHKNSTPTMGGLFVVAAMGIALALLGDGSNPYLPAVLVLMAGLTTVGAWDDLTKLRSGRGLRPRWKLAAQFVVAGASALWVHQVHSGTPATLSIALWGSTAVSLGWWFVPLGMLVIVGASNAVNLTDGLDGLAGGCLVFALGALGAVSVVVGNANLAAAMGVLEVPEAAGMAIVCSAACGAVLGFLWFNRHPARIFLGDTGSLPQGGLLGLLAIIARQELLLLMIAGVFVLEAASVILQVGYFKLRQRRIFLCAPLHHHFQFLGWPETRIVKHFWVAAALCAVVGLGCVGAVPRLARSASEGFHFKLPMLAPVFANDSLAGTSG